MNHDTNTFYYNDYVTIKTETEIIEDLKSKKENVYNYIKQVQEEEQKKIKEYELINFIDNLYHSIDTNKTILLKKGKNQFVCFNNWARYSVGKSKSGKFYNANIRVFEKYILEKEYKQYCFIDDSVNTHDNEVLNSLKYIEIA